ncbi:MAG: hypothetical protein K2O03_11815, partial [Lachnospiraceae bacterium]|nr:hypothetical protein [Lachnospiraceae bacterium]
MQKNKFKALFCCLLIIPCFMGFSTGCGKGKLPDYEYESTSNNLRVEEKDAIFMTSLLDVIIYHGEHANYYFDKNSSLELRDTYITTSEQVVQFLVENAGFAGTLEVYAADGMYYYNAENGKCALGTEYAGTSVQAALLIQAAAGSATVNYGLLQAEGFSVAKLFGWDISYVPPIAMANNEDFTHPIAGKRYELMAESESEDDYLTVGFSDILVEKNNFLLDFEYLCFSENYVEEKQVEYVWKLARSLSGYISENNKEQEVLKLLMECGNFILFEEKFVALRNAWLERIGSAVRVSVREYPVHYGNYGRFALFQMETLHGKWYVQGDFDASLGVGGEYAWIFRENYQDTDAWVRKLESELTYVDGFLRDKTYDYPELVFYFQKADFARSESGGYFDVKSQRDIYIKNLYALVHEYCHYLILQDGLFMEDGVLKEKYITQLHLLPYYYGNYSEITHRQFQKQYKIM